VRRRFLRELWSGLVIVWPVLSGLLLCMAALGVSIGLVEGWRVGDALYFAFVSGLTIGYGDLLPTLPLTKLLAVAIGATGILLTALLGAVGVQALARSQTPEDAD
jgi:hypothetical protein